MLKSYVLALWPFGLANSKREGGKAEWEDIDRLINMYFCFPVNSLKKGVS